ncbi:hypothetical protein [Rahnella perminowiae]|uniref:hypothetical protein n=1 Tax=Rahnella perminowiae TaxID=2816244 RepID=UPI00215B8C73|nr:hypothetical protein [Rahnella perminowiae]MCR8998564.1 hypothetical protein [Rahnella perminowiae]
MMMLSKHNLWPFAILVLAFIAYFGGWAAINHFAHIRAEWSIWRCTLLFGGIYLASVFFAARRKSFDGKIILIALGVSLVLGLLSFTFWIIVAWRLPVLNADDINALFLIEACCVLTGGSWQTYTIFLAYDP